MKFKAEGQESLANMDAQRKDNFKRLRKVR